MLARANCKYIRVSPYKLRPFIDVIRGKSLDNAVAWLKTCAVQRVRPVLKTLLSAYANAKVAHPDFVTSMDKLVIKEIFVDQGPIIRYFKPGAMGRACPQNRRLSHLQVFLDKNLKS
jgi:large subunit ribosomal protein L22